MELGPCHRMGGNQVSPLSSGLVITEIRHTHWSQTDEFSFGFAFGLLVCFVLFLRSIYLFVMPTYMPACQKRVPILPYRWL